MNLHTNVIIKGKNIKAVLENMNKKPSENFSNSKKRKDRLSEFSKKVSQKK